ncbi:hypothetical protein FNJ84_21160 [Paracoccus sp. M683]|uniref:hypothetical protein n=1 Tax=Paracoccus sp. M683 TaxID=2594268 RepID=UPI00117C04D4|nr:hypothetical protein [Paracoccus sp. M683]TRW92138.1 hypothetical protein FNJ84_21160 [Paracoccus sp. M683]
MSSKFRNTAAIIAIVTGLGGAALAQTATPTTPEAPQPPAAPVTVTVDTLPDVLKALNLQNIDIDQDGRRTDVEGTLADGTQIEAKLDRAGQLRKIEADDDAPLPASVIEALVPEAVRSSDIYSQFATVEEIGLPPAESQMSGVMIEGSDALGEDLRAIFAEDGSLVRFGRGDDDRRDRRDRRGDRSERGGHFGGKHGDQGGRGGDHGPKGDQARGDRPGGDGPAMGGGQPTAQLDDASVTTILTDAGYADLGSITRDGPRTTVEAVNAAGENVTVELNPRGEVVRETAR